jgi:hypothetical protein
MAAIAAASSVQTTIFSARDAATVRGDVPLEQTCHGFF